MRGWDLEALIGVDNGCAPEGVFLRVIFAVVLDGANALFHGLDNGIDGGVFALGVDENDRAADGADGVLQESGVSSGGRVARQGGYRVRLGTFGLGLGVVERGIGGAIFLEYNGDAILGGAAQELVGMFQLELELAAGEIRVDKETDGPERKLLQKAKRA